jgi:hypothetical protein
MEENNKDDNNSRDELLDRMNTYFKLVRRIELRENPNQTQNYIGKMTPFGLFSKINGEICPPAKKK